MKTYPFVFGPCKECSGDIIVKNAGFDKPTRQFCSVSCKTSFGNRTRIWTTSARKKLSETILKSYRDGKITHQSTPEYRAGVRARNLGALSHFWKDGISSEK